MSQQEAEQLFQDGDDDSLNAPASGWFKGVKAFGKTSATKKPVVAWPTSEDKLLGDDKGHGQRKQSKQYVLGWSSSQVSHDDDGNGRVADDTVNDVFDEIDDMDAELSSTFSMKNMQKLAAAARYKLTFWRGKESFDPYLASGVAQRSLNDPAMAHYSDSSSQSETSMERVENPKFSIENIGDTKLTKEVIPSPEHSASPFSILVFSWVGSLFSSSKMRRKAGEGLEQEDLWSVSGDDSISRVSSRFEREFSKRLNDAENLEKVNGSSLLRSALYACDKGLIIRGFVLNLLVVMTTLAIPILLNLFLEYINVAYNLQDRAENLAFSSTQTYGFMLAGLLSLALFIKLFANNHHDHTQARLGFRWRSSVTTAVYRKALNLGSVVNHSAGTGAIVNYMQVDAEAIETYANLMQQVWGSFLLTIGYLVILYIYVDWYAFAGIGSMFSVLPIALCIVIGIVMLQTKKKILGDQRVEATSEMLQSMQGVKMGAWEGSFVNRIKVIRDQEISILKRFVLLLSMFVSLFEAIPALGAFVAIVTFLNSGNVADASVLFVIVTSFVQLKAVFNIIPTVLAMYSVYRVSANRVGKFLVQHGSGGRKPQTAPPSDSDNFAAEIKDATFIWAKLNIAQESDSSGGNDKEGESTGFKIDDGVEHIATASDNTKTESSKDETTENLPVLSDITCNFQRGLLTAIVGPVGCGKSSLCSALLGELNPSKGTVAIEDAVAYAAQDAWMMNATIRDNILFGNEYDSVRYAKVLECCELEKDLGLFEHGDRTMIGEKGINLSGGQKQRISIARCAYSTRKVVILDDPLSALDPKVANAVFEKCITDFMASRTRILVTNQLNVLKSCDSVILLGAEPLNGGNSKHLTGGVRTQATFEELQRSIDGFAEMMMAFNSANASNKQDSKDGEEDALTVDGEKNEAETTAKVGTLEDTEDNLMTEEERSRGAVGSEQYWKYVAAGGGCCPVLSVIFFAIVAQACVILNTGWVTMWSEAAATNYTTLPPFDYIEEWFDTELEFLPFLNESSVVVNNDTELSESELYVNSAVTLYSFGYAVTVAMVAVTAIIPSFLGQLFTLAAAKTLHNSLLRSVVQAPMSFFDTTPVGRIVARFAKDADELDNSMGQLLVNLILLLAGLAGGLVTIVFVTPWFGVALLPLSIMYGIVLHYYRPVGRDVKRLEAVSRSPVFAQFSETLTGLDTIRAFQRQDEFLVENHSRVSKMVGNFYVLKSLERWRGVRAQLIGMLVLLGATLLAVFGASNKTVDAGLAGLSLTFALTFSTYLGAAVDVLAEIELMMNSVERMLFYSTEIPQEAPFSTPPNATKKLKHWPSKGAIIVSNLKMRYRDDTPLVLKGISFKVSPGERVGVIGRTGSGKSSLMLCILRLVEPIRERNNAPIVIDGVDICKIGLRILRRRISIVPQHPVVFAGTIRSNLDPENRHDDATIWSSLESCNLKSFVSSKELGLDTVVSGSGENLSQGQRQLLSLARAVLEEAKVLLLDEATSSIDFETDQMIQKTLRSSSAFKTTTLLVIAHRINTIVDSDKILVLDDGEVAEYDSPQNLLSDPSSQFSSMVAEHGRE